MKFEAEIKERKISLDIDEDRHIYYNEDEKAHPYSLEMLGDGRYLLRLGIKAFTVDDVTIDDTEVHLSLNGQRYSVRIKDDQALLLESMGFTRHNAAMQNILKAPMPGKILNVLHREGDKISKGEPLIILEAMKMENELTSPSEGTIHKVHVHSGDSVDKNATLIEISTSG